MNDDLKNTQENQIAKVLNIDFTETDKKNFDKNDIVQAKDEKVTGPTSDVDTDYSLVRQNLKKLIITSEIAIEGILNVASEGDTPRAYEVVSDLIKTSLEANEKLINLQQSIKNIKKEEAKQTKGDTVTNNSIFVGNTTDLLKMLKGKKLPISNGQPEIIEEPKDKT